MNKGSCIAHPKRQQLAVIREDYLAICENNHCAAALLNVLEYWTNIKLANREQAQKDNAIAQREGIPALQDESLWIYKTQAEFKEELLGLFGDTKIATALRLLEEKGFIQTRNNPRYKWDRTVQYLFQMEVIQPEIDTLHSLKISNHVLQNQGFKPGKTKAAIPQTTTKTTPETSLKEKEDAPKNGATALFQHTPETWLALHEKQAFTPLPEKSQPLAPPKAPPGCAAPPEPPTFEPVEYMYGMMGAYPDRVFLHTPDELVKEKPWKDLVKLLVRAEISPYQLQAYIRYLLTDQFWKGKQVSARTIENGIGAWLANNKIPLYKTIFEPIDPPPPPAPDEEPLSPEDSERAVNAALDMLKLQRGAA